MAVKKKINTPTGFSHESATILKKNKIAFFSLILKGF